MLEYIFIENPNDKVHYKKHIGGKGIDKRSLRNFWRGIRNECIGKNNRIFRDVNLSGLDLVVFAEIFENDLLIMILI